jgi:replicative DNA helicase
MTEEGYLKPPPHSVEAERSILGGLILDNHALDRASFLEPAHFYRDDHRRIFAAIKELIERGRPADMVLVIEHLEAGGHLDKAGGAKYIAEVCQNTPGPANVARYAELVRDKAILRGLVQCGTEVAEKALVGTIPPMELAEEAAASFLGIQAQGDTGGAVGFGQALVEAVEAADNPVKGLSTGYQELDRVMGAMGPGDMIIVAGRPSMGKTALAMNIAEHVAAHDTVAVLSLEMQRRKIAGRVLRHHELKVGREAALDRLYRLKLFIDDSAAMTVGQARVRLRKIQRQHGLKLVVVDYLQLMQAKGENRTQEVSAISRGLKEIAKSLNVVVLAVAQLNRGAEGRADSRPVLSDLRESGQIEQDADVIAFVYREDYYRPDTPWSGIAEVIVRKNRDGAIGTAHLEWHPETTRFTNMSRPLPARSTPEEERPKASTVRIPDRKSMAAGRDD